MCKLWLQLHNYHVMLLYFYILKLCGWLCSFIVFTVPLMQWYKFYIIIILLPTSKSTVTHATCTCFLHIFWKKKHMFSCASSYVAMSFLHLSSFSWSKFAVPRSWDRRGTTEIAVMGAHLWGSSHIFFIPVLVLTFHEPTDFVGL